jgi:GDP-D-mannose dehydratase
MWRILQQDVPEDYVIATGVTTILEICDHGFC